jgi:hypothetical protein
MRRGGREGRTHRIADEEGGRRRKRSCVAVVNSYESRRRLRTVTWMSSTAVDLWIDSRPGLKFSMGIGPVLQTRVG